MSPKKHIEDRFLNNRTTALHTNLFPDVRYPLFCIINLVLQPLVTGCFIIKLGSPSLLLIEDAKLPFPICYPAYHQACLGNFRVFHHLSAWRSENPSSNSCHMQYIATDPITSWKNHSVQANASGRSYPLLISSSSASNLSYSGTTSSISLLDRSTSFSSPLSSFKASS